MPKMQGWKHLKQMCEVSPLRCYAALWNLTSPLHVCTNRLYLAIGNKLPIQWLPENIIPSTSSLKVTWMATSSPPSVALWGPRLFTHSNCWVNNLYLQLKEKDWVWLPWKWKRTTCDLLSKWRSWQYLCTSLSAANRCNKLSWDNYFTGA